MEEMRVRNACIKETLRFYPPGAGALPRMVPKEGAIIFRRWVAGGTRVYTSPLATFCSPDNFHSRIHSVLNGGTIHHPMGWPQTTGRRGSRIQWELEIASEKCKLLWLLPVERVVNTKDLNQDG